jgi:threonine/homoserine/homoserine lactone efflux protein
MTGFWQGLGFGMVLQISVGPVCIAVLHKGLTLGFRHAFSMVWGVVLVDAVYIALSLVGVTAILQVGPARKAIGLAGALLLVYFGLRYLRAPAPVIRLEGQPESLAKSFVHGVGLTLTNPLTILFWAGVLGVMMSAQMQGESEEVAYFALGCVAATLLFLTVVALAGHSLERLLSERISLWLNRVVGVFLIGFALKLVADLLFT